MASDPEGQSWLEDWKFPGWKEVLQSFLGPFLVFIILESGTHLSSQNNWDNGSFGAAVVIMFNTPHVSPNLPRHIFCGQIVSALIAFAFGYIFPGTQLLLLRTTLAVAIATMTMKIFGVSYPPGSATAYILSQLPLSEQPVHVMFFYLVFPLIVGSAFLLVIGYVMNKLLVHSGYPKFWI